MGIVLTLKDYLIPCNYESESTKEVGEFRAFAVVAAEVPKVKK